MEERENPGGAGRHVHLVLSAGGMKCISYAGAIEELEKKKIRFASVSASSGGSIIGAILCAGVDMATLRKAVYRFSLSNFAADRIFPPSWLPFPKAFLNPFRWPFAKYRTSLVPNLFLDILRGDDPKLKDYDPTFAELSKDSNIPFATCGVDIRTHKIHVYSAKATPNMKVSDALRIATAVPLLYPPHKNDEQLMLDGALVSQSPVWLATVYGGELPILVLRPTKEPLDIKKQNLSQYLGRLIDMGGGSRDYYLINQIPRARLIEIDPDDVRFDQFDLPTDKKEMLIANGRTAIETNMQSIEALLSDAHSHDGESDGDGYRTVYEPSLKDDSEKGGYEAITGVINALNVPVKREQVFISYSHKDSEWLHIFQDHLKPVTWNKALNLWDDTNISSGALWYKEIKKALAAAKIAVLLVTPNYLASDFIREVELKEFLRASKDGELKILWVAVGYSLWEETPLVHFQAMNDPKNPLNDQDSPAKQQKEIVTICKEIIKAFNSKESNASVDSQPAHDTSSA